MKTDLSHSWGHCWVFQIFQQIECSTFTASSFRIWNSSTGILSPPLALFIVMLPKAHLTSYSRMSDSRWVVTPLWLSGSWRSFLYSSLATHSSTLAWKIPWTEKPGRLQSMGLQRVGHDWVTSLHSVYSCHLFLISSASVRSIPFLSLIVPTFAWNVPLVSLIFLKRPLVFPILLFSSISLHWLLRKAFLSFLNILWDIPIWIAT